MDRRSGIITSLMLKRLNDNDDDDDGQENGKESKSRK